MWNVNPNSSLDALNDEKSAVYTLPIIYVSIIMAFGVLGNFMVLFVYIVKIQKASNYRLFVLTLACLDITACSTGIPGLIVDMLRPYTYYSTIACKLHRYGYHVISCATSLTHCLIGLERHRKICNPLRTQLSNQISKLIIVFILVLALAVAIPAFFIYGTFTFSIDGYNITAFQCHVDNKYIYTSYPLIYDTILLLLVISVVLALCICYIQIGHQLLKSESLVFPNAATLSSNLGDIAQKQTRPTNLNRFKENKNKTQAKHIKSQAAVKQGSKTKVESAKEHRDRQISETSGVGETLELPTSDEISNNTNLHKGDLKDRNQRKAFSVRQFSTDGRSQKITAITFVLTVIFIVAYVPYLICVIVDSVTREVRDDMTAVQEIWYQIGTMSYVINNAANPIVYLTMDKVFRSHCRKMLCHICFVVGKRTKNSRET